MNVNGGYYELTVVIKDDSDLQKNIGQFSCAIQKKFLLDNLVSNTVGKESEKNQAELFELMDSCVDQHMNPSRLYFYFCPQTIPLAIKNPES